ncbi:hypothetical protein ABZW02_32635 [Streptomyces sp. NPDC005180]|uniref:hypothetical protein n=1 Tax=Streptomyces sp. NPDC005180 TaxID=3156868 RepID=UPI0033A2CA13
MISRKQHALASLLGMGIALTAVGTAHALPEPDVPGAVNALAGNTQGRGRDIPVDAPGAIKALVGNKGHLVEGQLDTRLFDAQCEAAIREKAKSLGVPAAVGNILQPVLALTAPQDCSAPNWDEIREYKVTSL